jgi:hypothetical protein
VAELCGLLALTMIVVLYRHLGVAH